MFGSASSSVVKKKRDLQAFVKWLTVLVPDEPSGAIKVRNTRTTTCRQHR